MDDKLPEGRKPYDEWVKSKRYAIVRTVSTFYHVYAVPLDLLQEMNTDAEVDPRWLEDSIAMEEIEELGQQYLGEQIIGKAEVVDEKSMLKIFDDINDYLSKWSTEQKVNFVRGLVDVHKG